ncbi:hypothetical protein [Gaopeijia maritima]|uniref:Uncharacterized protein n=1 Tax=Gaopeijia maritima TaxID=3119007 RepID=A0ABU9E979_9BACT
MHVRRLFSFHPPSASPALAVAALSAVLGVAACGPGRVVVLEPPVNAQEVVSRLEARERLAVPLRVVFDWEMSEQGVRVDGRGSARMEPPFKARLDLFLGNNEPAGSASAIDDDLRIPTELPPQVLPPANLLWSALGVFKPGLGTALLGAERVDGGVHLSYGLPGGETAVYRLVDGRIVRVEVMREGSVVQRLTLQRDDLQVPVEATYRDLVEVRELKLVRESVAQTEPFPPDIWTP